MAYPHHTGLGEKQTALLSEGDGEVNEWLFTKGRQQHRPHPAASAALRKSWRRSVTALCWRVEEEERDVTGRVRGMGEAMAGTVALRTEWWAAKQQPRRSQWTTDVPPSFH